MSHIRLRCTRCGAPHVADMATLACRECSSPLDVEYLEEGELGAQPPDWTGPGGPMPMHYAGVSLGEGDTPCVRLPAVARLLGLERVYGKLEFLNPTGSFKDRGTAVMMAMAVEHGVEGLVEDSSGNAGASVSAYAARSGIKAHIFAPASAPPAKLCQIGVYGAEVHCIEGPREASTAAAVAFSAERGLVYAPHALSPYFLEGTKTMAYEVARRFGGDLPGHLVFPVGNGSLIIGCWKGFMEMRDAGRIAAAPRLHCVQARSVMPIVSAYYNREWSPESATKMVAVGIAVGSPPRQEQVLEALRATNGAAVAVDDEETLRWGRVLAEEEGVFAEPTSAAAFAGLEQLAARGVIGAGEAVLVPVTGSGLKG